MRTILTLLWLCFHLKGLEVQVNFGKEKNQDFSVLNLKHNKAFECRENKDIYNTITSITCVISKTPVNNFVPTNTAFFGFATSIQKDQLVLTITPRHKIKLFATFLDLKQGIPIPKERPRSSKQWQIVGYISQIPFLSGKITNGLNFPIKIPSQDHLYIGQLDINLKPLHYKEGEDFKKLREIKTNYDKERYMDVFRETGQALHIYPSSIFKKDFLFYRIRSASKIHSKDDDNALISSALEWIKSYPADKHIPEVLYLIANAYIQNRLDDEAYYYYKRIMTEYPDTDWDALAKMQLAKNFSGHQRFKASPTYFAEAYEEAKTPSVKNEILLQWTVAMLANDQEEALNILDVLIKDHSDFFDLNRQISLELIKSLVSHKLYPYASKVTSILLKQLPPNDNLAKDLSFEIGEWYALGGDIQKAQQYNERFLEKYPNSKRHQQVLTRNKQLLLKMESGISNEEKLKLIDELISKYPDSPDTQKAYLKKAQILFELKRFSQILNIKDHIQGSPLLAKSKSQIILRLLQEGQCKQVPFYFQGSDLVSFGEQKLALFDCLYSIAYFKDAKNLIVDLDKQTLKDQLPWLYRLSKVLNKLGDFAHSRTSGSDTISIATTLQDPQYYDIGFVVFDDLIKLNLIEQAQKFSNFLQKHFKEDARMIPVWYALLKVAQKNKDDNAIQIYTKEILGLQEKNRNFDLTPSVEFILVDSLMRSKDYTQAQKMLKELTAKNIQAQDLQKALYMQGSITKAMGEANYKESFQKCLEVKGESSWKDLCSKSLEL